MFRTLILHPNDQAADAVRRPLSALGYSADFVGDRDAALRKLQRRRYRVLFFPEFVDGACGLATLRACWHVCPDLVAVMLSKRPNVHTVCNSIAAGVTHVLRDPAEPDELADALIHITNATVRARTPSHDPPVNDRSVGRPAHPPSGRPQITRGGDERPSDSHFRPAMAN